MSEDAHSAAEFVARSAYGRLIAILARRTGDIAAAEDALSEAFAAALRTWPESGVPDSPEAWLITAARRAHGKRERHAKVVTAAEPDIMAMAQELASRGPAGIPDERLALLFVCAHPSIDEAIRTPLMLQTVLGLDAARIAGAFLTPAATMAQRLVRAKSKIRLSGIRFAEPDENKWPDRARDVLSAIYAAYTVGSDVASELSGASASLADEALFLARLAARLLPQDPEAKGLLALILHREARAGAHRSAKGDFVPLNQQPRALWNKDMVIEAENSLRAAAAQGRSGRFQTEAAIHSLHAQAAVTGTLLVEPLLQLYDHLVKDHPTIGAQVARAVAYGTHRDVQTGLAMLDGLPEKRVKTYQPFWVALAELERRRGQGQAARVALERAAALTTDGAVTRYLTVQMNELAAAED